jgi:hypothetical protein
MYIGYKEKLDTSKHSGLSLMLDHTHVHTKERDTSPPNMHTKE